MSPATILAPDACTYEEAELARRLHEAGTASLAAGARRLAAGALHRLEEADLRKTAVLVVSPGRCGLDAQRAARLAQARVALAVNVWPVGTPDYEAPLRGPASFAAVLDVSFVSRATQHRVAGVEYHWLSPAPTAREHERLRSDAAELSRPIPWAVVGRRTPESILLVSDLMAQLHAGGVAVLTTRPDAGPADTMTPSGYRALLAAAVCSLWPAADPAADAGGARFLDAVLAGCAPGRIGGPPSASVPDVPGSFASAAEFIEAARGAGAARLHASAQELCLSRGTFDAQLRRVGEGLEWRRR